MTQVQIIINKARTSYGIYELGYYDYGKLKAIKRGFKTLEETLEWVKLNNYFVYGL